MITTLTMTLLGLLRGKRNTFTKVAHCPKSAKYELRHLVTLLSASVNKKNKRYKIGSKHIMQCSSNTFTGNCRISYQSFSILDNKNFDSGRCTNTLGMIV